MTTITHIKTIEVDGKTYEHIAIVRAGADDRQYNDSPITKLSIELDVFSEHREACDVCPNFKWCCKSTLLYKDRLCYSKEHDLVEVFIVPAHYYHILKMREGV